MRIKNLLYGVIASTILFSTAVVAKTNVIWWEYSEEGSGLNDALVKYIQDGFNQSQDNVKLEIIFKEGEYNEATRTAVREALRKAEEEAWATAVEHPMHTPRQSPLEAKLKCVHDGTEWHVAAQSAAEAMPVCR